MAILTVNEFRAFVTTSLPDSALQILLDAAEEEIVNYAGAPGDVTELIDGGWSRLALSWQASEIDSITETRGTTVTTLDEDDWRLRAQGYVLERLNSGPNARSRFTGLVTVVYTSAGTTALRQAVQVDLVKLDILQDPALRSLTIGEFSETYATDRTPEEQRASILSRLTGEGRMRVVGGPHIPAWL